MNKHKVSVVIIAKNEPRIDYTLESLAEQTMKPHEIIVVVDDQNDVSAKIAMNHVEQLPLKIVVNDIPGYGGARKKGVETSSGDIILFIDADCVADKKWIENLVKVFLDFNVMVQAGRSICVKSPREITGVDEKEEIHVSEFNILKFALTQNFAFRKEVVRAVGDFDPQFRKGGEDLDFCIRLRKAGYRIYYNPNAKVYHLRHRYSLRAAWRDGKSRARVFIKHGMALLNDAFICFFHSISLSAFSLLLVIGYPELALLIFTPSLLHRLYRAFINRGRDAGIFRGLLDSFIAYISHTAFVVSLIGLALQKCECRFLTFLRCFAEHRASARSSKKAHKGYESF